MTSLGGKPHWDEGGEGMEDFDGEMTTMTPYATSFRNKGSALPQPAQPEEVTRIWIVASTYHVYLYSSRCYDDGAGYRGRRVRRSGN